MAHSSQPVPLHLRSLFRLLDQAESIVRAAGGAHRPTLEWIRGEVARASIPSLGRNALKIASDLAPQLAPFSRLIACLLLLRASDGERPAGARWRAFAEFAVEALFSVGRVDLFPLRLELLDALLTPALAPRDQAHLLQRRANTRMALQGHSSDARALALRDIDEALPLARVAGDGRLEVEIHCTWARVESVNATLGGADASERLTAVADRVRGVLELAEANHVASDVHELLADTEGLLADRGVPGAALRAMQHARLAASDEHAWPHDRASRRLTLAEALYSQRGQQERAEAAALASETLASLPPDAPEQLFARAFSVAGLAYATAGQPAEAVRHLEQALALLVNGPVNPARTLVRVRLGEMYMALGREAEARHAAQLALEEAGATNDGTAISEATRVLAELDRRAGDFPGAGERLRSAEVGLPDSLARVVLALERVGRHEGAPTPEEVTILMRRFAQGEFAGRADVVALAEKVAGEHPKLIADDVKAQLLGERSPIRERHSLRALLLDSIGRRREALDELRAGIDAARPPLERLHSANFLVGLLPEDAHDERRAACDVLESLLVGDLDFAGARLDLASGLRMCARGDTSILDRAWRHGTRAFEGLDRDLRTIEIAMRALARIRLAQLEADPTGSSPAKAELASWFSGARSLPADQLSAFRLNAAFILMHAGPMAHPDALALADQLMALASAPPGEDATADLRERLAWIRRRIAGPAKKHAPARTHLPLDDAPAWAVQVAQGQRPPERPPRSQELATWVLHLMDCRPDRAGELLSWLVDDPASDDGFMQFLINGAPEPVLRSLLARVEPQASAGGSFAMVRLWTLIAHALHDEATEARAAEALLPAARTAEEGVEAWWLKGLERLDFAHRNRALGAPQTAAMAQAREHLTRAVAEAREHRASRELTFAVLVSAGNAFRGSEAPEPDRALALYEEASQLGAANPSEQAKLDKVTANALLMRGKAGDAERALALVERSLKERPEGYLRLEALLTASEAEFAQAGADEPTKLRRALARLDEARRHDDGRYTEGLAVRRMMLLARLAQHTPGNPEIERALDEIARQVPELADRVARARRGVRGVMPDADIDLIRTLLKSPAFSAYQRALMPFGSPNPSMAEQLSREMGISLDKHPELAKQIRDGQPEARSPQWRRAHVDGLAAEADPAKRLGAAVARARILSWMAEEDQAKPEEVRAAAELAESLLDGIPERDARHMLTLELSRVWAPLSHSSHPVRDFPRAAGLERKVLAERPPNDGIARLAMQFLARDTRYRTDGEGIRANLLEAERIGEEALRAHELAGELDVAEVVRSNLDEVRHELRGGDDGGSGLQLVESLRAQLRAVGSDHHRAQLAVALTDAGSLDWTPERRARLEEAKALFDAVDWARLKPGIRKSAENWRTMCHAELADGAGDRREAIAIWRRRVASLDRQASNEDWGYAIHNLANMLLRGGATRQEIVEGLDLNDQALLVRPIDSRPREHWETSDNIGSTILCILDGERAAGRWTLPIPPRALWTRGRDALLRAIAAARKVDGGVRLLRSALFLLGLARHAATPEEIEAIAEHAWTALDEARPLLLLDEQAGISESELTAQLAVDLAEALSDTEITGFANTGARVRFVLSGEQAERVVKWVVRAIGSAQRRLAARTARPPAVSPAPWAEWVEALQRGRIRPIQLAVERIRQEVPEFLGGEAGLAGTWRWLEARPGSAALAVLDAPEGTLAVVLEHPSRPKAYVAALEPVPFPEIDLQSAAGGPEMGDRAAYEALLRWTRQELVEPLRTLLPQAPSALLWVPAGPRRLLAPADLWPGCSVTCATRLDLEARPPARRPRSSLIAVADPSPASNSRLDLTTKGLSYAEQAVQFGPVRALLGREGRFGEALGRGCPGLVPAPPKPEILLQELAESDLAVLLCHGAVEGFFRASLSLLNEQGQVVPLEVEQIARNPRLLDGLTVVLLSCETGQVGGALHRAGGLAGALLAAGARSVVAPLWKVWAGPTVEVGMAVLRALVEARDVSAALAGLQGADAEASLRAFVQWVN